MKKYDIETYTKFNFIRDLIYQGKFVKYKDLMHWFCYIKEGEDMWLVCRLKKYNENHYNNLILKKVDVNVFRNKMERLTSNDKNNLRKTLLDNKDNVDNIFNLLKSVQMKLILSKI